MSALKAQLTTAMKDAMRAKEKARLTVLRAVLAAVKQVEVDERTELDDKRVLAILTKQVKQREDAAAQYADADRADLADNERFEIGVLSEFLPEQLSEDDIAKLIDQAIADTGASSMRDMGAVMGKLKPELTGRADMGTVSKQVKARLS